MLRLPKLPLSMTAVAVVTPSSGSNSAAVLLFWVVGADTCPSLFVARGPRGPCPSDPCALLFAAFHADGVRCDRSSIEAPGKGIPTGGARCPGATTEDRTVCGRRRGRRWFVRRGPPGGGGRPGGRAPPRAFPRRPSRPVRGGETLVWGFSPEVCKGRGPPAPRGRPRP